MPRRVLEEFAILDIDFHMDMLRLSGNELFVSLGGSRSVFAIRDRFVPQRGTAQRRNHGRASPHRSGGSERKRRRCPRGGSSARLSSEKSVGSGATRPNRKRGDLQRKFSRVLKFDIMAPMCSRSIVLLFWTAVLGSVAHVGLPHSCFADEAVVDQAATDRAISDWRDGRFGMFLDWGPVSWRAPKSVGRGARTCQSKEYDQLY